MVVRGVGRRALLAAMGALIVGFATFALPDSVWASATVTKSGSAILYVADAGSEINVDVEKQGSDYELSEFGTKILDGDGEGGCQVAVGGASASCPAAGTTVALVLGSAGNDRVVFGLDVTLTTAVVLGAGFDQAIGGSGPDILFGQADDDYLSGNAGNDLIAGGGGADTMLGNAGVNTISYADQSSGIEVDLSKPLSESQQDGDVLFGFQKAIGGSGNDRLIGDDGPNTLSGGSGDDVLIGKDGPDVFAGNAGTADIVDYSSKSEGVLVAIDGVAADGNASDGPAGARDNVGLDVESVSGSNADDIIHGSDSSNVLHGNAGVDQLYGAGGADTLIGWDGNDHMWGEAGNDTLLGLAGNDQMIGGDGNDVIFDELFGVGGGNDVIDGGNGADKLYGQSGRDTIYSRDLVPGGFVYWSDVVNCGANQPTQPDQAQINTQAFADVVTGCEELLP